MIYLRNIFKDSRNTKSNIKTRMLSYLLSYRPFCRALFNYKL